MVTRTERIRSKDKALPLALVLVVIGLTLFVLTLPLSVRDVIFLFALASALWLALFRFTQVWTIILVLVPFLGLFESIFGQDKLAASHLVIFGMFLAFVLQPRAGRSFARALHRPEFIAFALFIAVNVLSGLASGQIESIFRAFTYIEPLLYYLLTFHVVTLNPANLKQALLAIIWGGLVAALFGLIEIVAQRPIVLLLGIPFHIPELVGYLLTNRFGLSGRIVSTIGQPVYAALYFTVWLFITVYYVRMFLPKFKWLVYLVVPVGLLVIFATGTLATFFALAPTLLVLLMLYARNVRIVLLLTLAVMLAGIGIYLFLPGFLNFVQAAITLDPSQREAANALGRVSLTQGFFEVFLQNPILGNGPGLIQKGAQAGELPQVLAGLENQYAVILGDGGLAAGLTYLFFMAMAFRLAWRIRHSSNRELRAGSSLLFALLIFYFVMAISVMAIVSTANSVLMVVMGGFAATERALANPMLQPRPVTAYPTTSKNLTTGVDQTAKSAI